MLKMKTDKIFKDKIDEFQNKQLSEKFRLEAEKNEFKIEYLTQLLDKEEERRSLKALLNGANPTFINNPKNLNLLKNFNKKSDYEEKIK